MSGLELNVDSMIERLLRIRSKPGTFPNIAENELRSLILRTRDIFIQQPILLELEAPIKICGDIHGQYYDLLRLFEYGGFPPEANYLFLGDYVDRGKQSLECIILLLCYKVKYPENFFMMRGNHECASINRIYGFYDETKRRFSVRTWKTFSDAFNCLPLAAIIDEKIFCTHGGLSPDLHSLEQIRRTMRPTEIPDAGLLCDMLWSDPETGIRGWAENDRGVSYTFGADVVQEFLEANEFDLVCRAHQVVEDGYEFFARRQLVTIFSAPAYCFAAGTRLLLADGTPRAVEDVKAGDSLLGLDGAPRVVEKLLSGTSDMMKLSLTTKKMTATDLDDTIVTTNHLLPIFVPRVKQLKYNNDGQLTGIVTRFFDEEKGRFCQKTVPADDPDSYPINDPRHAFVTAVVPAEAVLSFPKDIIASMRLGKFTNSIPDIDAKPTLPDGTPVDSDIAWFIGFWLGDGMSDVPLDLCIGQNEYNGQPGVALRELLDSFCKKKFMMESYTSKHDVNGAHIVSCTPTTGTQPGADSPLLILLQQMGFLVARRVNVDHKKTKTTMKYDKRINVALLRQWPHHLVIQLLAGLLDADGYVEEHRPDTRAYVESTGRRYPLSFVLKSRTIEDIDTLRVFLISLGFSVQLSHEKPSESIAIERKQERFTKDNSMLLITGPRALDIEDSMRFGKCDMVHAEFSVSDHNTLISEVIYPSTIDLMDVKGNDSNGAIANALYDQITTRFTAARLPDAATFHGVQLPEASDRLHVLADGSVHHNCGEFDNAGAMMSIDETLMCSFQILKPLDKAVPKAHTRPPTPPQSKKKKHRARAM